MATNYKVNYDDKRFTEVEADKKAALSEVDVQYGKMIGNADKYYDKQIQAVQDYADKQSAIQQQQTDFAIEKVEQQKAQAKQDYTKEQSGAYVDWQKQSGEYGANAEAMAAQGMIGTGFSESSQVRMYTAYQNRVAMARESYNRAILDYDNAIKDARLQNNAALAEIAYNTLQKKLELALAGFQYKNQLLLDKAETKREVDRDYHTRYQDVLKQINTENALAEEVRQYNERMAEEKRQYNATLAMQKAQLAEEQRQFNETMAYQKSKDDGAVGVVKAAVKGGSPKLAGSAAKGVEKIQSGYKKDGGKETVTNRHTDSWVEVGSAGRFSWSEVLAHVNDGSIKEVKSGNKITYKWVGKKSGNGKNVTPDKKGYTARQRQLMERL